MRIRGRIPCGSTDDTLRETGIGGMIGGIPFQENPAFPVCHGGGAGESSGQPRQGLAAPWRCLSRCNREFAILARRGGAIVNSSETAQMSGSMREAIQYCTRGGNKKPFHVRGPDVVFTLNAGSKVCAVSDGFTIALPRVCRRVRGHHRTMRRGCMPQPMT